MKAELQKEEDVRDALMRVLKNEIGGRKKKGRISKALWRMFVRKT